MTGFKLATAWKFIQDKLRLAEPKGEVNFRTSYRFDYPEHAPLIVLENGNLALKGLDLVENGGTKPLVSLDAIEVSGMGLDLKRQLVTIPEIRLSNGRVSASVNENGVFNWQTLVVTGNAPEKRAPVPSRQTSNSPPWQLKADSVKIENVAVDYKDASRANPLALTVGGFNLSLKATGAVGSGEPEGTLDNLQVKLIGVNLYAEGDENPLVRLDEFVLDGGKVDIGGRSIQLNRVEVKGGESRMVRDHEGRIHLVEAFAPADRGMLKRKIAETGKKARSEGKPWAFLLDSFTLNDFKTLVEDHTFSSAVQYTFQDISATLKKIGNDGKTPIEFGAELKVAQGGHVKVNGQLGPSGDHAEGNIEINGFNLTPLQPAIAQFTTLGLKSGNLSTTAKLKYQGKESGPQLRADGSVRIDQLRLDEAATNERALEWRSFVRRRH